MQQKRLEIGIIGLGKFGTFLGQRLMELGHTVIGIDKNETKVRRARDELSRVFQADAMDRTALEQTGFKDLSKVVVSVGDAMEASILITLNMVELGVPDVWTKAVSFQHEKVLSKIGASNVFIPERYGAHQLALRMSVPGLVEYLPVGEGLLVQQLSVDKWSGRSLRQLDLTNRHGIQVVAVRRAESKDFVYLPKADVVLTTGDELVVFVQEENLGGIEP